ncbi:MAG TPA: class I SAM-dependent methyltransferase [Thermoanaerobaculia bacterium]|jgi:SAM-dependent methyltransferase|nr:class I SAM-dependent methyltransferase [Thermoanaerobaculia bacterium]
MRANYGIDAPGVIRNLLLVTFAGLLIWGTARAGLWSGFLGNRHVRIDIAQTVIWPAVACGLMAVWMLWHSTVGKVRGREALLDQLQWSGSEQVLDVGCGRGLFLIGAAKRLTGGSATGIDIWQSEDLSGNRPDATLENARLEGVADRVKVETADMRKLPFPDASFDTVVSSVAIHNLYAAADRAKAIAEIARVLKPGGQVLIDDIRHGGEYSRALTLARCTVRRTDMRAASLLLTIVTFGSLQPATLVARKA